MMEVKKTLFRWEAPSRPVQKKSKEFWTTVFSLAFLFSVILFFAKEYFLIVTIFSFIFVYYALLSRPAEKVTHQITNQGLSWGGQDFAWETLHCFWFEKKENNHLLVVDTYLSFPKRLIFVISPQDKKKMKALLGKYLSYEKPPLSFTEKLGRWLAKTFPLESASSLPEKK